MNVLLALLTNKFKLAPPWIQAFIVALVGVIGIGSVSLLGPDNEVEQAAEIIIKQETGVTIDFDTEGEAIETITKSIPVPAAE